MNTSRRQFLKTTIGGIALTISPLTSVSPTSESNTARAADGDVADWQNGPGRARFRIDGHTKVTGRKIYARDFRAKDLDGWPKEEEVAMVMRVPMADRVFKGIDLSRLPTGLRPKSIVTAMDLYRDYVGIAETDYPAGDYLVSPNSQPKYQGQAAALLYYDDYFTMDQARRAIRSDPSQCVNFGDEVPPPATTYYEPETSIVHVRSDGNTELFSQVTGGPVRPQESKTKRDVEALGWVDKIRERLENPGELGWTVRDGSYETQVIDPMFMEPESGLAWLDRTDGTLHLLIGSQSPSYDAAAALEIFSDPMCKLGIKKVNFISAFPGGGFGGRDTSMLCLFLAIAASYSERPIRIVYDRFEQFQAGMKRHASRCDVAMAVDKELKFRAIRNYIYLNGGGRRNVSGYVAQVAGLAGTGPYAIPLADIWSRSLRTTAITSGSVRGFGSLQSQFAVETMVDELAHELGVDPIELRRRNVLQEGQEIDTGAVVAPPGLPDMCDQAMAHRLWRDRDKRAAEAAEKDFAYGVGFAVAMKNYGTGADAALDEVAIDPEGRITITTNVIDMGTGTATTLAIATASRLGANATKVNTGYLDPFAALELEEGFKKQPDNPRWTPIAFESTKASSTSSKWVHGVEQACDVLLATGLLPAARELWGSSAQAVRQSDVSWVDGALSAPGHEPIALAALARQAHAGGHVVSAMIHAFYSGRWVEADYTVGNETFRWQIDALSVLRGGRAERQLIDRQNPKLFTVESIWEGNGQNYGATGCLAAVRINRKTGEIVFDEAVLYIGPGKVLQQDLMEGQLDGCVAMGVGQALLENIPAYAGGGGTGHWNLHRYHVPLSGDVALGRVEKVILPPESEDAPARGIAELGMLAVPPAINNAVFHATGIRFRRLPITAEDIRTNWGG